MNECTRCGQGTITNGFCDYCGFAPPPLTDRGGSGGYGTGTPRPAVPAPQPESPAPAPLRFARYGPLEMAGVDSVPYQDPKRLKLTPTSGEGARLRPGELVGGQYRVEGCLGRGGMGWVYLAYDNNVGHWVALKGLRGTDPDVADVPEAERAALAAVNYPNIVKIHNFVQHPAPEPGTGPADVQRYIVMEYVGGRTLQALLNERRRADKDAVLPVEHVIAYGIEMLRALAYLHSQGLLYCDLKPSNVMQCERRLTLIDLGGAQPMDGTAHGVGTPRFMAPEVAIRGEQPSIRSDLYTVGRTMAMLSLPPGPMQDAEYGLPERESAPLLERFDSYHRLLRRATADDPADRFADAAEMEEQLFGVLREAVSAPRNSEPWPVPSTLFGRERAVVGAGIIATGAAAPAPAPLTPRSAVTALPVPVVSGSDGAPGLPDLAGHEPREIVEKLTAPRGPRISSLEERLVLAGAYLDLGRQAEAEALLALLGESPHKDWRVDWYRAVATLAAGRHRAAGRMFDYLYTRMPGEAAPKLALAFCREDAGDFAGAARHYESVWRTDHGYLSAAFGLARVRLAMGDRDGAVRALDEVPSLSRHYGAAQLAAMAAGLRGRPSSDLSREALLAAARRLGHSRIDGVLRRRLEAEVLEGGLAWIQTGQDEHPDTDLIGTKLTLRSLRRRLERTYRELAWLATDTDAKHALVDKANAVRPMTLL
ncbi:tetratricopeptide repeat protein [Actinomadura sp. SCN-SB]|uniref:serine/threonine protein kinase n=1 Tax=Actinomadura sp. SCN-SB TaxID=3373092 RepID=UPI0037506B8C